MKVFLDDIRIVKDVYPNDNESDWFITSSVQKVKELLLDGKITELSLDNDLGPNEPEGRELVKWMINNDCWPLNHCYVHSANIVASCEMVKDIVNNFYNKK